MLVPAQPASEHARLGQRRSRRRTGVTGRSRAQVGWTTRHRERRANRTQCAPSPRLPESPAAAVRAPEIEARRPKPPPPHFATRARRRAKDRGQVGELFARPCTSRLRDAVEGWRSYACRLPHLGVERPIGSYGASASDPLSAGTRRRTTDRDSMYARQRPTAFDDQPNTSRLQRCRSDLRTE